MARRTFAKPKMLKGQEILALGKRWKINHQQLTQFLNVPPKMVREWQQHPRKKLEDGPILRLIELSIKYISLIEADATWREFQIMAKKLHKA